MPKKLPVYPNSLFSRYVHSGIELVVQLAKPVVIMLDANIDRVSGKVFEVKTNLAQRYHNGKEEVIMRAKGYKSAISEQVSNISSSNVSDLRSKVQESVRQAPDVVRSISNKAVSLTKQGLEISIGHEKTETVVNTVITHTPRFVTSLLAQVSEPSLPEAIPVKVAPGTQVPKAVSAH